MLVVKLGGSLYQTDNLRAWLNKLDELSEKQPIVIVPGGGPFADQVRNAQQQHQFDDSYAHQMAILAMSQFGLLLQALTADCQSFHYPGAQLENHSGLAVWLPTLSLSCVPELAHSWQMTSDSLALWLAQQLQANQLALVKSCSLPEHRLPSELSALGIIDKAFPALYQRKPLNLELFTAQDHEHIKYKTSGLYL